MNIPEKRTRARKPESFRTIRMTYSDEMDRLLQDVLNLFPGMKSSAIHGKAFELGLYQLIKSGKSTGIIHSPMISWRRKMTENKLEPCTCCSSTPGVITRCNLVQVKCECGMSGPVDVYEEKAISLWNTISRRYYIGQNTELKKELEVKYGKKSTI